MLRNWYGKWLIILTFVAGLSWLSYVWLEARTWITVSVLLVVFIVACYRLLFGVAAVLAELVIGSQGYLLGITSPNISLRLGLFTVIGCAAIIWMIRDRRIALLYTRYWKWYLAIVCVYGIAAATALWHGNHLINLFLDMNGYLYIAMIIPFTQAIRTPTDLQKLFSVFWAGVTLLIIETIAILFVFSHQVAFQYYLPDLYRWLRDFRLAEITMQENNFTRIFFQSHLYVLFGFIAASLQLITKHTHRVITVLAFGATLLLLFISYSRSFWVATVLVIVLLAGLAYRQHLFWKYIGYVVSSSVIGYAIVLGIINVPILGSGAAVDIGSLFVDRTSDVTSDVGGGSRIALLKPLTRAAFQHPLLGSGFGTTVTYATKDPRALQTSSNGVYTTYAFEWGYLDLWLKLGLVGTIVYISILAALALRLWYERQQLLAFIACVGVIAVGMVHLFTPYLNHPLGLSWVILATCIASVYDTANR